AAGRLSAVSCLVNGVHWADGALLLRGMPADVDLGLHFNLTEGRPQSAELAHVWPQLPALPRLIAMAHLRRVPRAAIRAELEAQLGAFGVSVGRAPRFIDGHQHVHHLPGVRSILLDAVARMQPKPAVRNTGHVLGPAYGVKRTLIERTGGRALARELMRRGIAHNAALTGVYDFEAPHYRVLMQRWLAEVGSEGALLFCHPGAPAKARASDPIAAARLREFAYLRSADFGADLAASGFTLGPVWRDAATA
ncbi:MAG: ChbG/HpnK family deacetylase, partial [Pseudomonadota bacterium]|nr:ChbG/HpnK family deacetylase [Pseudomonadota bacterium]